MLGDVFESPILNLDHLHLLYPELALYSSVNLKTSAKNKLHDLLAVHCLDGSGWNDEGGAFGATALWLRILSKPVLPPIRQKKEEFIQRISRLLSDELRLERSHSSVIEQLYSKMKNVAVPVTSSSEIYESHHLNTASERGADLQQFKCYMCTLIFSNKYDLSQHFARDHANLQPPSRNNQLPAEQSVIKMNTHVTDNKKTNTNGTAVVPPRRGRGRPRKISSLLPARLTSVGSSRSSAGSGRITAARLGTAGRVKKSVSTPSWISNQRKRKPYKPTHHRTPLEQEVCNASIGDTGSYFTCKHCAYTSPYIGNMRKHVIRRHTDIRPFTCTICGYKCAVKQDFDLHQERCKYKPGEESTTPNADNTGSNTEINESTITDTNNAPLETRFTCDQCSREFHDYMELQNHISEYHRFLTTDKNTDVQISTNHNTDMKPPMLTPPTDNEIDVSGQAVKPQQAKKRGRKSVNGKGSTKMDDLRSNSAWRSSDIPSISFPTEFPAMTYNNVNVTYTATGLKRDTVRKLYLCKHCNYSTRFNGNLKKHCQRVHPEQPWEPDLYLKRRSWKTKPISDQRKHSIDQQERTTLNGKNTDFNMLQSDPNNVDKCVIEDQELEGEIKPETDFHSNPPLISNTTTSQNYAPVFPETI